MTARRLNSVPLPTPEEVAAARTPQVDPLFEVSMIPIRDAARAWRVSERTILRRIEKGRIHAVDMGDPDKERRDLRIPIHEMFRIAAHPGADAVRAATETLARLKRAAGG